MSKDKKTPDHPLGEGHIEYDRGHRAGFEWGIRCNEAHIETLLGVIEEHCFSLQCGECDADGPASRKLAREAGWRGIRFDDGISWNFTGTCPECGKEKE